MSSELVEVTPTDLEREGGWKATAAERAFSFPAGSHLHRRQKPFPLRQTLPHITATPQVIPEAGRWRWTWTSQLHPPSLPSKCILSFFPPQQRASEVRALQRDRKVSCGLGNFLQAAWGAFHKKPNHMVTVQQSDSRPPSETHQTNFLSPGF